MGETRVKSPTKFCPMIMATYQGLVSGPPKFWCISDRCAWWVPRGESTGYCGAIGCEAGEAQMAAELYGANRTGAR